jgi:phosphoglycerate kinase
MTTNGLTPSAWQIWHILWRVKEFEMKLLQHIEVTGKRVLVRVDFNVPLDKKKGDIADDRRIRSSLATIDYLIGQRAKVILLSHLGRPDGHCVEGLRMTKVAERLLHLLDRKVRTANDCVGPDVLAQALALQQGELLLLENLRFHPEEESNDPEFAQALAQSGEVYVNDAFSASHREHASIVGIARLLPSCAGFLMQKEVNYLTDPMESPESPFVVISGGAKVSDKLVFLGRLMEKVDTLLIGGGMAFTFLKAQGREIGDSICEDGLLEKAKEILRQAEQAGVELLLPIDVVVAKTMEEGVPSKVVSVENIPAGYKGLDIGPLTRVLFAARIRCARTIVWNGPVGVFEIPSFAEGTQAVAVAMAASNAITIVGGGDSAAALDRFSLAAYMTHVSMGGGASLEFLEGRILPGIAVLEDSR